MLPHQRRKRFDSCILFCIRYTFFFITPRGLFSSYTPGLRVLVFLQRLAIAFFLTRLCTSRSSNQTIHPFHPIPSCEFASIPLFCIFCRTEHFISFCVL